MNTNLHLLGGLLLGAAAAGCSAPEKNMNDSSTEYPDIRKTWDFQDPEASRESFEELVAEYSAPEHRTYELELQTQVARTWGLEGEYARSHALLDEIEPQLDAAPPVVRVRYLLERGRTLRSGGKPEEARPLFDEAWTLAKSCEAHGLAVDAAHMVAIVEKGKASLAWNQMAIDYAEGSGDPEALDWLGSLYNNTGWSYHDMEEYETALGLWEKAVVWQKERNPGTDRERVARYMVGRGLRSLKRYEQALEIQRALLAEIEEKGLDRDGYVHEEIAEDLFGLGKEAEAAPHFGKAYDVLSKDKWFTANEADRLARMHERAGRN